MTKVILIIKSYLNDVKVNPTDSLNEHRLNFVLLLITKYSNTSVKIDDDEINELWNSITE
jgi:hypothetical protein